MLKRILFVILLSLTIAQKTYALPQLLDVSVMVRLYVHADNDDSNAATYPIKRLLAIGIRTYVGAGIVYIQNFNESFTLRLIDIVSNTEVFSLIALPG